MYLVCLLVAAAAVCVLDVGAVCPGSADKCIDKSSFSQLSQNNATKYCTQGPVLVASALACLDECQTTDTTGYLDNAKSEINSFCQRSDSKCPNVCDMYVNQTKCFAPYGGRQSVVQSVLSLFDASGIRNETACKYIDWGRSCQKLTTCSFNLLLDLQLLKDNPNVLLGTAICGTESLPTVAAQVEDNSKCSADIDTRVKAECDVACSVKSATSAGDICEALESQAACLEKNTDGCADLQRNYLLPRMISYAMANNRTGCNIKLKGVRVQTPSSAMCNFTTILNTCIFAEAVDNAIDWNRLKPLLDGDMPIGKFCKNLADRDNQLLLCKQSMLLCPLPQALLLSKKATYAEDYSSNELGCFSVGTWGALEVWNYAKEACKTTFGWTVPLCNPQQIEVMSTVKPTNQMRTTPTAKNPNVVRNELDSGNYQQQTDEGRQIVVSFALVVFAMLMALMKTM